MKRQIVIEIDAEDIKCGGCDDLESGECSRFRDGEYLNLSDDGKQCLRCGECLQAESRLRALVDAGEEAEDILSRSIHAFPGRIGRKLQAALAAIKGEGG